MRKNGVAVARIGELMPLLGVAAFVGYIIGVAWPSGGVERYALPPDGCSLLLGYMLWPIGLARAYCIRWSRNRGPHATCIRRQPLGTMRLSQPGTQRG